MQFSTEQKELLEMIYNLSQREDDQPRSITFEAVISDLSPSNCFVNFVKKKEGFRIFIYNNEYKDIKKVESINGKILTYLFLIDLLVKSNLVIIYKLKEPLDYENVFISDKNKKEFTEHPHSGEYITDTLYSPTFWEIIEKYGSTVIQPSYSLIKLIRNDFRTDDEISTELGLRKATKGLKLSVVAIFISLAALIFSIFVGLESLKTNERIEAISRNALDIAIEGNKYSKRSSTEQKQIELIEKIDSLYMFIKENYKLILNNNENSDNIPTINIEKEQK